MSSKRNKNQNKLLLVAGARPNFMKVAPLVRAISAYNHIRIKRPCLKYCLVHTGQHYDMNMSEIFFSELGIPAPHINMGVGAGTHASQTAKIMMAFELILLREKPDWVIVVGDVNSTLACALTAVKLGIKTAHVEAGLRSFDRTMPEEINRLVTDTVADALFTPSLDANENLRREGIPNSKIHLVGNIMIDSIIASKNRIDRTIIQRQYGLISKKYAFVTLHRPSNVDNPNILKSIFRDLRQLSRKIPVIFPVHPRTRNMLSQHSITAEDRPNLRFLEPVGYYESLWLTKNALFVLTDSGGLQEESTYFGTPCLTLRPNTERPVTISLGTNRLTSHDRLSTDIKKVLVGDWPKGRIPKFWDGHTAERIMNILANS